MLPSAYVALCDGETPKNCPPKRIVKAVAKSIQCIDDTLTVLTRKPKDESSPLLFGALEGGYDAKSRRLSAEQMSKR